MAGAASATKLQRRTRNCGPGGGCGDAELTGPGGGDTPAGGLLLLLLLSRPDYETLNWFHLSCTHVRRTATPILSRGLSPCF